MKPISPVVPGFNLPEVTFAKDQPEYIPLPAYRMQDESGTVVTRWRLSWMERLQVLLSGDLWLSVMTFHKSLQPVKLEASCPIIGHPMHDDESDDILPQGFEWRVFHWNNAMSIAPDPRHRAVEFLRNTISKKTANEIRVLGSENAEWWSGLHFGWGMQMRNALRLNGLGEKELGVDNLDDYCMGLVELAVGLTKEEEQPVEVS